MTDADLSVEALGRLSPRQLLTVLEQLGPDSSALTRLDVDAIGRAIDPKRFGRSELAELLVQLDRLAAAGAAVDLHGFGPHTFARLISRASDAQLRDVLARDRLRTTILSEIFRRMQDHLRVEKARSVRAVIHWRFSGGTGDGGYDRYETVIADGQCATTTEPVERPRVTITMHPADFVKLITGNGSAPVLFVTGKLKVRGDLAFAAGLIGLFDLPRA